MKLNYENNDEQNEYLARVLKYQNYLHELITHLINVATTSIVCFSKNQFPVRDLLEFSVNVKIALEIKLCKYSYNYDEMRGKM